MILKNNISKQPRSMQNFHIRRQKKELVPKWILSFSVKEENNYGIPGLQIYGGHGSLSHDFKIWPITFQGSGPSGPILLYLSCEKISL